MLHVDHLFGLVSGVYSSSAVLRQAVHLAHGLGATLHAMPIGEEADRGELHRALEEYVGASDPIEVELVPSPDTPDRSVRAVRRYVGEREMDLVVADTPGDRGPIPPLADSFVGSLMGELDRPVYVVGQVAEPKAVRRILVPTDLSDPSLEALRHAAGLASIYGGSVMLLHVIDTSPYVALTPTDRLSLRGTSLPEHRARRRLQRFVKEASGADVPVHTRLKFGEPANQIAHFVDQEAIDLVVLSSHGTATRPQQSFGRVADRVLRRVRVPFFFVPAFGRSLVSGDDRSDAVSMAESNG